MLHLGIDGILPFSENQNLMSVCLLEIPPVAFLLSEIGQDGLGLDTESASLIIIMSQREISWKEEQKQELLMLGQLNI